MPPANYPTNIPLIDNIANWAGNNAPILQRNYSLKGGWEGWAQVELARLIPNFLGGSCSREDEVVYTNNDRADIYHENPLNNTKNVIELKCQSTFQDLANIAGFATAYTIDAGKIQPNNRGQNYRLNTNWVVIGIAPGGTHQGGAVENAVNTFNVPTWAYYNSTHWTQRDQNSPVIFWTTY